MVAVLIAPLLSLFVAAAVRFIDIHRRVEVMEVAAVVGFLDNSVVVV